MYIESSKKNSVIVNKWFVFCLVLVIMVIVFGLRVTGSEVHDTNNEQAECFREIAPKQVREILENHLFSDSGVMLTASFENDYVTGFTVMISNKYFSRLNDISKQVLSSEIEKVMMDTWDECGQDINDANEYPAFAVILN